MSETVSRARRQLEDAVFAAVSALRLEGRLRDGELRESKVEIPALKENGDFSINTALVNSRLFGLSPRESAGLIIRKIKLEGTYFSRCEAAGPGFINFFLSDEFYADVLLEIAEKGEDYGSSDFGRGEKVLIEFVSANPTGPMHMGNARGGALGDCLASVMEKAGFCVSREFYVNDAGNQIEKFALSLDLRYRQALLGEEAAELPEDSYHGDDIKELAQSFAEKYGDSFLKETEEKRRAALVAFALPLNIASMHSVMDKYRIHFDRWFYESELHRSGEVAETVKELKDRGYTYEKDGALWYKNAQVRAEILRAQGKSEEQIEKLQLKDDVLIRQNGFPTYFAVDIAYHRNKILRGFTRNINIWGADHHGHVERLKGALYALGLGSDKLEVLLMQLVRLTRNGEAVKMSKRTGRTVSLRDLLDEIPVDAARFLFNLREAGSQMDFDLALALKQSSDNPVYYCQYAHARICSIIKKLKSEGIDAGFAKRKALLRLREPEERELIMRLSELGDETVSAAKSCDPARITRYCIDISALFHKFYNTCRVNESDSELRAARIHLCLCVRLVLKNTLELLKLTAPEEM